MKEESKRYLLVGGAFLGVLCLLLLVLLFTKTKKTGEDENNRPEPSKTQVVQTQTTYELPNNMSYQYDAEAKQVTLFGENFTNPPTNERLLQYSVKRKSDGTVLYQSELLQPGASLESITFSFDVEPGEYEIYLISASIDSATKEEKNSVMTPLTLVIP